MAVSEKKRKIITRTLSSLAIAGVVIPAYFVADGMYLNWILRFGFAMSFIELLSILHRGAKNTDQNPLDIISGFILVIIIFSELIYCAFTIENLSVELVGGCMFVCACTDITAYLMGTYAGGLLFKRRPFPKVSPNKSFEGLIFGLSCGAISAFVWTLLARNTNEPVDFHRLVIVAPISVFGDYMESRFKRIYGVKDANDYLINAPILKWPERLLGGRNGHGGYLDRLDSLILTLTIQLLIL